MNSPEEEFVKLLMAKVEPIRDVALKRADAMFVAGDYRGAETALIEGFEQVNKIITDEVIGYVIRKTAIEPMMQMLGIKR